MRKHEQLSSRGPRRWLALLLVGLLAATGSIATAGPASAGPCDSLAPGEWLGSWAQDSVAEAGGVARFSLAFSGNQVSGTLQFAAGQTVLVGNDAIVGARGAGSCSFTGTVGGLVTIEGTITPNEQEVTGAWSYAGATGSWRAGRVTDSASGTGTTVTTDETASGVSTGDPIATTVETPDGGLVTIDEAISTGGSVSGYSLFDTVVRITAPVATVEAPLILTFDVHTSAFNGSGSAPTVFRNGVAIPACQDPSKAIPDPCLVGITNLTPPGTGLRFVVRTSQASTWFFGIAHGKDPRIVSEKLLSAKLGVSYSKQLTAVGVAGTHYKWKKLTKLPKGLKLAAKTGLISGIPKKQAGTFVITVALISKSKAKGQPKVIKQVMKSFSLTIK
jgi:hypothetical protein